MSDIQKIFRNEITRLARKEVKGEIESLKKTSAQQRGAIADLRRQIDTLTRPIKQLSKGAAKADVDSAGANGAVDGAQPARRFSATRLAAHRTKLGLSAASYGQLVGVSGQTIYNWEQGSARPRAAQLQALVAVRTMNRAEVSEKLAAK